MLTLLLAFSLGGSVGFFVGCVWHARFGHAARSVELGSHEELSIDQPRL